MSTVETKETIQTEKKRDIWDSFVTCLKKYGIINGRASRYEYWSFYLVYMLIAIVLTVIDTVLLNFDILASVFYLAVFIPSITVTVRRLHDINKSGWWYLLPFSAAIPLIIIALLSAFLEYTMAKNTNSFMWAFIICGIYFLFCNIYLFYLFCKRGDKEANRFGESPL